MKKTIYIYINSYCFDPVIYTSLEEARKALDNDIDYFKERYKYDDDDIRECYDELNNCSVSEGYIGTYLGDTDFDIYIREIEI